MNCTSEQELVIALGSNLGSAGLGRRATLSAALSRLSALGLRPRRVSRFFATPCFPAGAGPDYVNACAVLTVAEGEGLDPGQLLERLHSVESDFDRLRETRWGSRTLDLDLIAVSDAILPDEATYRRWLNLPPEQQVKQAPQHLILPHPRLQDRGFVLVPLADVAPDWVHPVLNLSVRQMAAALPQDARDEIRPL
jgi:2-amino-4-hydroxy-6-hydroxymethyldihydropteridine diphosphokinase